MSAHSVRAGTRSALPRAPRFNMAWLAATACLAITACKADEPAAPTQIVVVVDAEGDVRDATVALDLTVRATSDANVKVYDETLRAEDRTLRWPWVLAITPKDGDASRRFEVVATARDEADDVVGQVRALTTFVQGEKRTLFLTLEDACIGVDCDARETCSGGTCESAEVDPTKLPTYDADELPDPVVVGPRDRDAGTDGGGMMPPTPDAGRDSGTDAAAPDDGAVPRDAMVDPGCTLNPNPEDEVCPQMCPETCNGLNDDCDLKLDEGEADDECAILPNAVGTCLVGECEVVDCANGWKDCDEDGVTGCESGTDDVDNCGMCGNDCSFPNMIAACVDDVCEPVGCLQLFADCDMTGDSCEVATNTLQDCGNCGVPCENVPNAEASCASGYCGPGVCVGAFGDCNMVPGDGCEQPLNELAHCGECGEICDLTGSTDDCSSGTCVAVSCDPGYADCDGDPSNGCESLATGAHCGTCNRTCDATLMNVVSASCDTGVCVPVCDTDAGFGDCDPDPFNGCETLTRNTEDCGACGMACDALPNALMGCDFGTCEQVRCVDGYDDCNGDGLGCEQSLDEPQHCGSCFNDCTVTSKPNCSGGLCTSSVCLAGTADCDEDGSCETDLTSDGQNCNSCGNVCEVPPGTPANGTLACVNSACVAQCDMGFADCNDDYLDGCEVSLTTLVDCVVCGQGCAIANATATCVSGTCEVELCDADWDDCDGDGESCETPLNTTADCGECLADCAELNGLWACGGDPGARVCELTGCEETYFADCDESDASGCEVDTRSANEDCGACGTDCSALPNTSLTHCTDSACVVDGCDPGFDDCGSGPGCETTLGTTQNCSACEDDCSELPNTASATCNAFVCDIGTCSDGFDSCDLDDANGCETNLHTVENCGGCAAAGANEPCTNLPNVTSTSCAGGACQLVGCAPNWVDCNGNLADGCEQSLTTVGPCFPDNNCTKFVFGGRDYFFCITDRNWAGALSRCDTQVGGALVRIDGVAENAFVVSHLGGPAWIGANDLSAEGQWNWIDDLGNPTLFWLGGAGGTAQNGLYTSWGAGEPNASGNCAATSVAGAWGDEACTAQRDFVCEVQADLCPNDPSKTYPGQCGCGVADTDGDGDGTANCNDGCPQDPNKVAAGQCGCGVADTDDDGDGTANCDDGCPDDGAKTTPGACGCGVADTDTDLDGTPDCVDTCPYGMEAEPGVCRFPYTPSNFNPGDLDYGRALDVTLDCAGDIEIDTTDEVYFTNWCGDLPTPVVVPQAAGTDVVVLAMLSLRIADGVTLRVRGKRPLILAVAGNVSIEGYLDAHSYGSGEYGAGSGTSCSTGLGGNGIDAPLLAAAGGGGGGGFGTPGGGGGTGYRLMGSTPGGSPGGVDGIAELIPLMGGCPGGNGGAGQGPVIVMGGTGGRGGGAVQLSAAGLLYVAPTGAISVSGGGGSTGDSAGDGGGGGGAGGALLLEGAVVQAVSGAWVTANGGGGGSGIGSGGSPGTDGYVFNDVRAPGGLGMGGGGNGGLGASARGPATTGGGGTAGSGGSTRGGGGGGGGGVGRIRINGLYDCVGKASFSPDATFSCP